MDARKRRGEMRRMRALGWGLAGAAALMGLYLFLIAPKIRRRGGTPAWFRGYFAHRGLHGGSIPENSLPAFALAAEGGWGIELDVHLTRDGRLVVHHDESLLRTCGVDRLIRDMTLAEISRCRLMGTDNAPPALEAVLSAVGGSAPLIVEIKTAGKRNAELARKVYEALSAYSGPWCVESFDPRLLRWFRKHAPAVFRGQLAYDPARLGEKKGVAYALGAHLLMNCISRPDFVAYGHETDANPSFRLMRCLFHPPLAAWTVRSDTASKALEGRYDAQIFEGFLPQQEKEMDRHE